jgi:hypothetical protein
MRLGVLLHYLNVCKATGNSAGDSAGTALCGRLRATRVAEAGVSGSLCKPGRPWPAEKGVKAMAP